MAISESGVQVWLVKAVKDETILPCVETRRVESEDTIWVEAEVQVKKKGLNYHIQWQKTNNHQVTCDFFTAPPNVRGYGWTQRGHSIQMAPAQDSVVFSSRDFIEGKSKCLFLSKWHFGAQFLTKNHGITGYIRLHILSPVLKSEGNAAMMSPKAVFFTFIFKHGGALTPTDNHVFKMPLASSPSMVQHPGRKVHGIKKNTRQVNSSELEGSAKSVLRPSTRQARQVNQSRSDVDPHSSEETEDRAQSVVRTRPSTRQVNRLEPDADPDYLDVTEGAAEVNHSEPEIDPESFDVTERRAEPPRRFETSRRNAAPKRKAGTMEDTLDSDPAANLAAVQQDLEKARIAFKQAQIEQSEAIREKLLLLEEETKRLNEGTEKIRDDIHHFKRRKLQL